MQRSKILAWSALAGQVPALLAVGVSVCPVAMVGVITAGVIMRYVVGNPLLGVNEIVQLIAVALAMLALPYATGSGAHVRVGLLDTALGFDPIWFGVIAVIVIEMGMITPPVGPNVFVVRGVAGDVSLATVFRGVMPFLVAMILTLILIVLFPGIALWIPDSMFG